LKSSAARTLREFGARQIEFAMRIRCRFYRRINPPSDRDQSLLFPLIRHS
jgi:hypothetical protein